MINIKNIYRSISTLSLIGCLSLMGCGSEDIKVGLDVQDRIDVSNLPVALTVNENNKAKNDFIEFRTEKDTDLYLTTTKQVSKKVEAKFVYNKDLLDQYNFDNGTKYEAFPEELVVLSNDGVVFFEENTTKSSALQVHMETSNELEPDVTYVIPVSAQLLGDVEELKDVIEIDKASNYFIYVRDLTLIPSATKAPYTKIVDGKEVYWKEATKVISCMEVNDTNPLNNLCFTLKNSGKPLIDIVILFSGNINYNAETGKVFNHNNPNVQHLLDNREKYLKPLQDRGIKVVLGILGNHDRAAITNLSDETAKAFAKELKSVCEAYSLDGIFYDDEYSKTIYPAPAGFVFPSNTATSRLVYETKQVMPEKLVMVYVFGGTSSLQTVDDVLPGQYIDFAISDYGQGPRTGSYPGTTNLQMSPYSQEYNLGRSMTTDVNRVAQFKEYGGHMIFAMDPNRSKNKQAALSSMKALAQGLYDDELIIADEFYKKDW